MKKRVLCLLLALALIAGLAACGSAPAEDNADSGRPTRGEEEEREPEENVEPEEGSGSAAGESAAQPDEEPSATTEDNSNAQTDEAPPEPGPETAVITEDTALALAWLLDEVELLALQQSALTPLYTALNTQDPDILSLAQQAGSGTLTAIQAGTVPEAWLVSCSSETLAATLSDIGRYPPNDAVLREAFLNRYWLGMGATLAATYGTAMLASSAILSRNMTLPAPAALEEGGLLVLNYDIATVIAAWCRTPEGLLQLRVTLLAAGMDGVTLEAALEDTALGAPMPLATTELPEPAEPDYLPQPTAPQSMDKLVSSYPSQLLQLLRENCLWQSDSESAAQLPAELAEQAAEAAASMQGEPRYELWTEISFSDELLAEILGGDVEQAAAQLGLGTQVLREELTEELLGSLPSFLTGNYAGAEALALTACAVSTVCPAPSDAQAQLLFVTYDSGAGVCILFLPDAYGYVNISAQLCPTPEQLGDDFSTSLQTAGLTFTSRSLTPAEVGA